MKRLVLIPALALILAACGGGSGGSASGGAAADDSSTSSTTVGLPKSAADRALIQGAVLTLADLPAGWSVKPETDDSDNDDIDAELRKLPECKEVERQTEQGVLGKAKSARFIAGNDAATSNEVEIYPSVAAVDAVMKVIPSAVTVDCFKRALQIGLDKELEKDPQAAAQIKNVTVTGGPIDAGAYGDGAVGIGLRVSVEATRTFGISIDLVAVKVGPTLTTFTFQDTEANPLADLRPRLISTTVGRLQGA